MKRNSTQHKLQ